MMFAEMSGFRIKTLFAYDGEDMIRLIDNTEYVHLAYNYSSIDELLNSIRRIAKEQGYYIKTRQYEGKTYAEIYVKDWELRGDHFWHKFGFRCEKLG